MAVEVPPEVAHRAPSWVFLGQGTMGAAALEALLGSQRPQVVLTAAAGLTDEPVARIARAHGLAVAEAAGLADEALTVRLGSAGAVDVVVVGCWAERIGPAALAAPTHGWWNLHPSALPSWRGADPVSWQLLAGARQIGCSVHAMTPGLDDGAVLARATVPVDADDDRDAVLARAGTRLGALAAGLLADLRAGRLRDGEPQDEAAATWCPPVGTTVLLDPASLRAAELTRLLRAVSPAPGAGVVGLGDGVRVVEPEIGPRCDEGERPGDVVDLGDGRAALACRDRWVHARRIGMAAGSLPVRTPLALDDPPGPGPGSR